MENINKKDDKKKLEINEDNYEAYTELLSALKGLCNPKHKVRDNTILAIAGVLGVSALVASCVAAAILEAWQAILIAIFVTAPSLAGIVIGVDAIGKKLSLRSVKRDYPDLDIDVDKHELEKELVRYNKLSKLPKDIEKQKDEHSIEYSDQVKEMTTQEKIEYFQREKEFWENYAIKEKYENKVKNKSDDIMRMKN